MSRLEVTEKIIATKVAKGLKWADVAADIGLSKEWVTAGCLGQMTFNDEQAAKLAKTFDLTEAEAQWLKVVPYKGSLPTSVYGTTFKELIHEEFGDGIMSAIDFKMDLQREPNAAGDRVSIVMSGKFLPYKTY
jgi:cyanate lyase